jgi:hypothetical protein
VKVLTVDLFAPRDYGNQPCWFWDAEKDWHNRGCGPGEGVGDVLVPDHLLGLGIQWACAIHDWMYAWGIDLADKDMADRVFRQNMRRIIKARGGLLKHVRYRLADIYYWAVAYGGTNSYWNAKHEKDLQEVVIT